MHTQLAMDRLEMFDACNEPFVRRGGVVMVLLGAIPLQDPETAAASASASENVTG